MPKLRVHNFAISLDGYGASPNQDRNEPLGVGGEALHKWFVATRTFQRQAGRDGGATGIDDDFAARGFPNMGAWIMGRNMFGPVRGPFAIAATLLGAGEHLLAGIDAPKLGYRCIEHVTTANATHVVLAKGG